MSAAPGEEGLKRVLKPVHLWAIAVGLVISGDYFGWNYGVGKGGPMGMVIATLDHNQLAELYAVRTELEGLAARLAARAATDEEIRVLRGMVTDDRTLIGGDPRDLARANKRFHKQIHLASHNRFLVQQLDLVHRSMALMATTSFAAEGRDAVGLAEHDQIIAAIEARDPDAAYAALRTHISKAFETRLRVDAGELKTR